MRFLRALSALLCCSLSSAQTLDPGGKNVCKDSRYASAVAFLLGSRTHTKLSDLDVFSYSELISFALFLVFSVI